MFYFCITEIGVIPTLLNISLLLMRARKKEKEKDDIAHKLYLFEMSFYHVMCVTCWDNEG